MLDPRRLAAYQIAPPAAGRRFSSRPTGSFSPASFAARNQEFLVETGGFLENADDVQQRGGRRLRRTPGLPARPRRTIEDGAGGAADYVFFGHGPRQRRRRRRGNGDAIPAVTITVAKRKGTNAIVVADGCWQSPRAARTRLPQRRASHGHAQLRRDRQGEVQRAAVAHAASRPLGDAPDRADPGLARIRRRR